MLTQVLDVSVSTAAVGISAARPPPPPPPLLFPKACCTNKFAPCSAWFHMHLRNCAHQITLQPQRLSSVSSNMTARRQQQGWSLASQPPVRLQYAGIFSQEAETPRVNQVTHDQSTPEAVPVMVLASMRAACHLSLSQRGHLCLCASLCTLRSSC